MCVCVSNQSSINLTFLQTYSYTSKVSKVGKLSRG